MSITRVEFDIYISYEYTLCFLRFRSVTNVPSPKPIPFTQPVGLGMSKQAGGCTARSPSLVAGCRRAGRRLVYNIFSACMRYNIQTMSFNVYKWNQVRNQGEDIRPSGREVPGAATQGSQDTAWLLSLKEGTATEF